MMTQLKHATRGLVLTMIIVGISACSDDSPSQESIAKSPVTESDEAVKTTQEVTEKVPVLSEQKQPAIMVVHKGIEYPMVINKQSGCEGLAEGDSDIYQVWGRAEADEHTAKIYLLGTNNASHQIEFRFTEMPDPKIDMFFVDTEFEGRSKIPPLDIETLFTGDGKFKYEGPIAPGSAETIKIEVDCSQR